MKSQQVQYAVDNSQQINEELLELSIRINEKRKKQWSIIKTIIILTGLICISLLYLIISKNSAPQIATQHQLDSVGNRIEVLDNTSLQITFNENQINQLIYKVIGNSSYNNIIDSLWIDLKSNSATMNYKKHLVTIPISTKIIPKATNQQIHINYKKASIGKLHIPFPFLTKSVNNIMTKINLRELSLEQFGLPTFIRARQVSIDKDINITLEIDYNTLNNQFKKCINNYNQEVIELYCKSDDKDKQVIAKWVKNKSINRNELTTLLHDYKQDKIMITNLIGVFNDDIIYSIFDEYGKILSPLTAKDVLLSKGKLLADQKIQGCKQLITALDSYKKLVKRPLLQYGFPTPFDYVDQKLITVDFLRDYYHLPISDYFIKNTSFIYDKKLKDYCLVYNISEQQKMIWLKDRYELYELSFFNEKYKIHKYEKGVLLKKDDKDRMAIQKELENFLNTDKVVFRYIKSDYKNAFAVVSDIKNYQLFTSYVLKKGKDRWEIIDLDIKDFNKLNSDFPEFNITLVPTKVPNLKEFSILSDNDIKSILMDLYDRKIIKSQKVEEIQFCSYYDPYIYIVTKDGAEYIYKLSYGFLSTVHKKNDIKNEIKSLPQMLFIQG